MQFPARKKPSNHARTLNEYEQEEEVPCKVRIQFFASSRNRSRRGDSSRREKEPAAGPVCVFLWVRVCVAVFIVCVLRCKLLCVEFECFIDPFGKGRSFGLAAVVVGIVPTLELRTRLRQTPQTRQDPAWDRPRIAERN